MEPLSFPPSYLIDGCGLNVADSAEWIVTLPGDLESVLMLPALARLVPFRFFGLDALGEACAISALQKDTGLTDFALDDWESHAQYEKRLKKHADRQRCEQQLYDFERSFSAQVEVPDGAYRMYWVVFPAMPKVPKDVELLNTSRHRASTRRLDVYNDCKPLRDAMCLGELDYSSWEVCHGMLTSCEATGRPNVWRALPTLRGLGGVHPWDVSVDPATRGNYHFPLRGRREVKVGFVAVLQPTCSSLC
jgi:hypothetical protein